MDLVELKRRILEIRGLLASARANLVQGEGLEQTLKVAEEIADGVRPLRQGTQQSFIENARAMTAAWNFAETLRPCVARGFDLTGHLRTITTGSMAYGQQTPSGAENQHYFKDFELELFIASHCIRAGMAVSLNPVMNDPSGDLFVQSLRIEIKHPESVNQLESLLRKFNTALYNNGMYGIIAVGLEDIFEVEPMRMFESEAVWSDWLRSKADEIEAYGATFFRMAARMTRVLGTIQTLTLWKQAAGGVTLHRQGNAAILDDRKNVPPQCYADVESIAAAFNPEIQRWSQVKFQMPGAISDKQLRLMREALHVRAYRIYDDEGRHPGRELTHWLQAKQELGIPEHYHI